MNRAANREVDGGTYLSEHSLELSNYRRDHSAVENPLKNNESVSDEEDEEEEKVE